MAGHRRRLAAVWRGLARLDDRKFSGTDPTLDRTGSPFRMAAVDKLGLPSADHILDVANLVAQVDSDPQNTQDDYGGSVSTKVPPTRNA
jgi:hypothetical protein